LTIDGKRIFDAAASAFGLILLSPILLLIGATVRGTSRGPAIFRAERVGRGGRTFQIWKFRTMRSGAPGPRITAAGDPRVTGFGRLLRRTKLDELPQLVNVLRGDMSLVGPRPEDPFYVEGYTAEQRKVLSVRPGITSEASLRFRREEALLSGEGWEKRYRTEILPEKLRQEIQAIERRTFFGDLAILAKTLFSLLSTSATVRHDSGNEGSDE
jgi:lipopolysaccharide/colanic/teichoic acid biosynthesis glycosyltransferase